MVYRLYDRRGQGTFEESLTQLLEALAAMMRHKTDNTLLVQAACLKYLPSTIPDILKVFDPVKLRFGLARKACFHFSQMKDVSNLMAFHIFQFTINAADQQPAECQIDQTEDDDYQRYCSQSSVLETRMSCRFAEENSSSR